MTMVTSPETTLPVAWKRISGLAALGDNLGGCLAVTIGQLADMEIISTMILDNNMNITRRLSLIHI